MTAPDDELTPWEQYFLDDPGEHRGYQPIGEANDPDEPPEPPQGPAGASPPDPDAPAQAQAPA
ncbi:hypothetical protein [Streptomyces sp. BA2]|uniref:hypothetical protein n=1 Tax=Streptomyces sp. BA2 TaxID=436595 RepID=UPI001320BF26|nr:hypothetical protein [Streptomyces sp. BA2]MWA08615.1 hypothetical protein [Streptomyces sp. BA2]